MSDCKRIERLFSYTKFHIGFYITFGGGFVALAKASAGERSPFRGVVVNPELLGAAVALMALAGFAGGVVASSTTQCTTFDEFWGGKWGPYRSKLLYGEDWAALEHWTFWLSLAAAVASVWI